jgi:hypothetical protein
MNVHNHDWNARVEAGRLILTALTKSHEIGPHAFADIAVALYEELAKQSHQLSFLNDLLYSADFVGKRAPGIDEGARDAVRHLKLLAAAHGLMRRLSELEPEVRDLVNRHEHPRPIISRIVSVARRVGML